MSKKTPENPKNDHQSSSENECSHLEIKTGQTHPYEFDLVVLGSGPGGQKAAVQAAKVGKKIAIIERHDRLGGGCVHWGTLPSKSLRESVYRWSMGSKGILSQLDEDSFVCSLEDRELPDMERLMQRKERVIDAESEIIREQILRNQVKVFSGHGEFTGRHELKVQHQDGTFSHLRTAFAIIATGARPVAPKYATIDGVRVHDSTSILSLKQTPKSMIVLGAGVIGCEYASIFQAAGTKVTLVDKRNEILSSVDREIICHLTERFERLGMKILLNADTTDFQVLPNGVRVKLSTGETIEADMCLIAMGRQGNTERLGLDRIELMADSRGQIKVGKRYQSEVSWVYAVGDVVGFPALASTSMEQGRIAVCDAFGLNEELSGFEVYPYGIYTIPEISTIGETEEELKAMRVNYVVGRAKYMEVARGQIVGDEFGILKILIQRENMRIRGIHILGDNAADLIHIGQAVMQLGGDLHYFIRSVFNYPTLAEAYKTAAFNAYNQIKGRS